MYLEKTTQQQHNRMEIRGIDKNNTKSYRSKRKKKKKTQNPPNQKSKHCVIIREALPVRCPTLLMRNLNFWNSKHMRKIKNELRERERTIKRFIH